MNRGGKYAYVKVRLETLLEKHLSYVRSLLDHGGKESSLFSTSFYADEKIRAYFNKFVFTHLISLAEYPNPP